jgi:hypothetical protein
MPAWHCRLAAPSLKDAELCDGPQHDECGMRYAAGEFSWDGKGDLHLDGVPGVIHVPGLAYLPLRSPSAVIVWQDKGGWNAEFEGDQ